MLSDPRTLILGSSSRWRQDILREAGYRFRVEDPDIDEKAIRDPDPAELVRRIASAKASALRTRLHGQNALVIACDQVGVYNDRILEKPGGAEEAREMLASYRGGTLRFYTAVHVFDLTRASDAEDVDRCDVAIGDLPNQAISAALERGDVLGSCGAFVYRDPGIEPYARIVRGSLSSCEGLPLHVLHTLLERHRYGPA